MLQKQLICTQTNIFALRVPITQPNVAVINRILLLAIVKRTKRKISREMSIMVLNHTRKLT